MKVQEKLVRAIIVAVACTTTAWWLLRDTAEQEPLQSSMPLPSEVHSPRAADSRAATALEVAARADEPTADVRPATLTGGDQTRTAVATGAGEIVEPIPMIEGITLPGGMWNLHSQMEREPRDIDWADGMERQFATYFASKPALARNFGSPSVLCRMRSCEIQAVGYGPDAFTTWSSATADLRDQPWGEELFAGGIYTTARAPSETAVVLILMRTRLMRGGVPPPR